jgi:hypothetical protein
VHALTLGPSPAHGPRGSADLAVLESAVPDYTRAVAAGFVTATKRRQRINGGIAVTAASR